jgi:hypothetical protein
VLGSDLELGTFYPDWDFFVILFNTSRQIPGHKLPPSDFDSLFFKFFLNYHSAVIPPFCAIYSRYWQRPEVNHIRVCRPQWNTVYGQSYQRVFTRLSVFYIHI